MRSVWDRFANVRCMNCRSLLPIGFVRELLWRPRFFSFEQTFFWEKESYQYYSPPVATQLKCHDCLMRQQLRKNRIFLIEGVFWVLGAILSALMLYAALRLLGPEPQPKITSLTIEEIARRQRDGSGGAEIIMILFILMPIPPLCFFVSRNLSYWFVAFDIAPQKNRSIPPGLPK